GVRAGGRDEDAAGHRAVDPVAVLVEEEAVGGLVDAVGRHAVVVGDEAARARAALAAAGASAALVGVEGADQRLVGLLVAVVVDSVAGGLVGLVQRGVRRVGRRPARLPVAGSAQGRGLRRAAAHAVLLLAWDQRERRVVGVDEAVAVVVRPVAD